MSVNAELQAVADTIHAHTKLSTIPGIAYDVGRLSLEEHGDVPLVNWVNPSGSIEASSDAGVEVSADGVTQFKLIDVADLEVHIWASEEAEVSARVIAYRLMSIAVNEYEDAISFTSYAVETEEVQHADIAVNGEKVVLVGTIRFPILDVDADGTTTVKIETHTHTPIFIDPTDGSEETV